MRKELGNARLSLDECRQKGEQLGNLCGDPGMIEIRKQLEDIHHLADDVHDIARDREEDLKSALTHAEKFQQIQEVFHKFWYKNIAVVVLIKSERCCLTLDKSKPFQVS